MRRPVLLVSAALIGLASPSALAALPGTSAASPAVHRLTNTVVPGLAKASLLGAVPSTQKIQVSLALAHPDMAGENAYVAGVYNKKSPLFHHFMTPAQYSARFGVSAADFARTTQWLTRDGLKVGYAAGSRTQVLVEGTAAQASKTFDVKLNNYSLNGHSFRANTTPALAPSNVITIEGLQTISDYVLPKAKPANDTCLVTCIGAYTPQELWKVYGQPTTNMGAGVRAAIIGEGRTDTTIRGLRNFEAANHLRQVPTRSVLIANPQTAATDDTGADEWEIDSQALTGMAPDLQELSFYFSASFSTITDSIAGWVNDPNGPSIANMSIGGCEILNLALGGVPAEENLLRQAAIQGRTLFVSTGDTGGSCLFSPLVNTNGVENTGVPNPQWPSTSEFVVGVGGTVLYTNETTGQRDLEYTWTHGGGGTSSFIPAPPWQQSLLLIKAPCSTDDELNPVIGYTVCRGVPDVSALSGDVITNGYTTYNADNTTFPGGGTSLSSPLWAGMWARIQAASAAPLGLATPTLYGLAEGTGLTDFDDISVGTNVQWQAMPRTPLNPTGWDFTNGLGTPVVHALMQDITGRQTPVKASTTPATLDTVTVGSTGTGGGTGTGSTGSTSACVGNGSYADPVGDSVVYDDEDLTKATIAQASGQLVLTATVADLEATPLAKEFDWNFTTGGKSYQVAGVLGLASDAVTVYDHDTFTAYAVAGTTIAKAANTVTVTVPVAAFNAVSTVAPLTAGSKLGTITIAGDLMAGPGGTPADEPIDADDLDATACGAVTL